jgi:hypothetical protein
VRSLALAAAEFHAAEPWRRLGPHEIVRVISPGTPEAFASFAVCGRAGGARGIEFLSTPQDLAACQRARASSPYRLSPHRWRFTLEPVHRIPIADSELWECFALPVAADDAYPMFVRYPARGTRVSARPAQFDLLEALLRALSHYTPVDLELGHVRQRVHTYFGERDIEFVIPTRLQRLQPGRLFAGALSGPVA